MTKGTGDSGPERPSIREGKSRTRLARRLIDELTHRADLALFADGTPARWTDALLAETRFHLAGTMNAMEMAIKLEVTDPDIEAELNRLGQPYCSLALEKQVDLISPELLSHYRLRAALSLVLRGRPRSAMPGESLLMDQSEDGLFAQSLAALTLTEQGWCGPLLLEAPLRPDLPAEQYCDLAWTTAALLIRGVSQTGNCGDRLVMHAIIQAVERVIARHDEGNAPFALARRAARALSDEQRLRLAPAALAERRLLLFCALVEAEMALALETVLAALIDGGCEARHAILRLMDIEEALAVQVHDMLAPLKGGVGEDDAAMVAFVEQYRAFGPEQAHCWLSRMQVPSALVAKLTIIDPTT